MHYMLALSYGLMIFIFVIVCISEIVQPLFAIISSALEDNILFEHIWLYKANW